MKQVLEICQLVASKLGIDKPTTIIDNEKWLNPLTCVLKKCNLKYQEELVCDAEIIVFKDETIISIKEKIPDFREIPSNAIVYVLDKHKKVVSACVVDKKGHTYSDKDEFELKNDKFIFSKGAKRNMYLSFAYYPDAIVWKWNDFTTNNKITDDTDVPCFDEYEVITQLIELMKDQQND